jgi:hypothetical protein
VSALYNGFAARVFRDGVSPGSWQAVIVTSAYTFSRAHTSVATSITPSALSAAIALAARARASSTVQGFDVIVDVAFADADAAYPVGSADAIVVYQGDVPLLYLDEETFPELPATTLGGAVELHFSSALLVGMA